MKIKKASYLLFLGALSAFGIAISIYRQDKAEHITTNTCQAVSCGALDQNENKIVSDSTYEKYPSIDISEPAPVAADTGHAIAISANNVSIEHFLDLRDKKQYQALLKALKDAQFVDPFFIEDLLQKYLNSESIEDREKVWAFITLLKDEAVTDTLAMAIATSNDQELSTWLKVVPETAAFQDPRVRESVVDLIHNSNDPEIVAAALDALNVNLSEGVDRGLVESVISEQLVSSNANVRIAAIRQQADWFDEQSVKDNLMSAFSDQSDQVQIAVMSVLEEKKIRDEAFRDRLLEIAKASEENSELYSYSVDTLEFYYGLSGDQIASVTKK